MAIVETIKSYYDTQLDKDIEAGTLLYAKSDRAKELVKAGVAKIVHEGEPKKQKKD